MKYKTSVAETAAEQTLRREDGWNEMQVRFVIEKDHLGSEMGLMGYTVFPVNGASHEMHLHENAEEYMYITRGVGRAVIGDESFAFRVGDVLYVPKRCPHYVANTSDTEAMEMVWVYAGSNSVEASGYRHYK